MATTLPAPKMHPLPVALAGDHLHSLTRGNPLAALSELIWNSLDADATAVSVSVTQTLLTGTESIVVADNGTGMSALEAAEGFSLLGGSKKRNATVTGKGRIVHGRRGQGRLRAFALGPNVEWKSTFDGAKGLETVTLRGKLGTSTVSFEISDAVPENDRTDTGTEVTVTGMNKNLPDLHSAESRAVLARTFALFLRKYPDTVITIAGEQLDANALIARSSTVQVVASVNDKKDIHGTLDIIEWNSDAAIQKYLYLCDSAGNTLHHVTLDVGTGSLNLTAHLSSPAISEAATSGTLILDDLNDDVTALANAARQSVRDYVTNLKQEKRLSIVEEWKADKVYPFENAPVTIIEEAERRVFDILAINVVDASPAIAAADDASKKLTFRLLRSAIESGSEDLQHILIEVLGLSPAKQEELSKLLSRSSLSAIISASSLVADRLDFLEGLHALAYGTEYKNVVKERTQLHRIVAAHTWLFGEELNITADDQKLDTVVRQECGKRDDIDILALDGSVNPNMNLTLDLMFSKILKLNSSPKRHHLVVELKRPSEKIDLNATTQVMRYAQALMSSPAFPKAETTWEFWALSSALHVEVEAQTYPTLLYDGRGKVYVKTWADVINDARARLEFFKEKLELSATKASGIEFLKREHDKYLPQTIAPAANPATKAPKAKTVQKAPSVKSAKKVNTIKRASPSRSRAKE